MGAGLSSLSAQAQEGSWVESAFTIGTNTTTPNPIPTLVGGYCGAGYDEDENTPFLLKAAAKIVGEIDPEYPYSEVTATIEGSQSVTWSGDDPAYPLDANLRAFASGSTTYDPVPDNAESHAIASAGGSSNVASGNVAQINDGPYSDAPATKVVRCNPDNEGGTFYLDLEAYVDLTGSNAQAVAKVGGYFIPSAGSSGGGGSCNTVKRALPKKIVKRKAASKVKPTVN